MGGEFCVFVYLAFFFLLLLKKLLEARKNEEVYAHFTLHKNWQTLTPNSILSGAASQCGVQSDELRFQGLCSSWYLCPWDCTAKGRKQILTKTQAYSGEALESFKDGDPQRWLTFALWKFKKLSLSMVWLDNLKERQCQRMFRLPHNCTHLTW